jgi:hypothetical protein
VFHRSVLLGCTLMRRPEMAESRPKFAFVLVLFSFYRSGSAVGRAACGRA